ncbi:MAG TPA: BrnT family toxin [Kiritimatiellia bacterium]|nr:BrnT family toxin [Kiritimatiellia bacterium]HPS07679.1 BrnT family toxin [Kiritimatiellia bacterium]
MLEAEQVFFNSPLLAQADEEHSVQERRFFVLGQTDEGRELFVAFTMRVKRIRVISARDMSRQERRIYRS